MLKTMWRIVLCTLLHFALDRFLSQAAGSARSDGQPVAVMRFIADVDRWLRADADASRHPQAQHVKEAMGVLKASKQAAVKKLCVQWHVQQKVKQKEVKLPELIKQIEQKALAAANKLRQDLEQSRTSDMAGAERPASVDAGPMRMFNAGNTCFLNASVQCLRVVLRNL